MCYSEDDDFLELDLSDSDFLTDAIPINSQGGSSSVEGPEIGTIFAISSNFDWALVELDDAFVASLVHDSVELSLREFEPPTDLPYTAYINTVPDSRRHGLLSSKSFCLFPNGIEFVEVYDFVLDKTS